MEGSEEIEEFLTADFSDSTKFRSRQVREEVGSGATA